NVYSWNNMLSGYSKLGMVKQSRALFDKMTERDVISWNTMIIGYAQSGFWEEGLRFYRELRRSGIGFNDYSFAGVLTVCVKMGELALTTQVHGQVLVSGFLSNVVLSSSLVDAYSRCQEMVDARRLFDEMKAKDVLAWTTLVSGYAKSGDMNSASELFDQMPEKNPVSWTTMISGYARNSMGHKALELFSRMMLLHIRPDQFTYSSCLCACASISLLKHGKQIHGSLIKTNLRPNAIIVSSLVDMYSKCGNVDVGRQVFEIMGNKQDSVLWNTMISALAQHGRGEEALQMFDAMVRSGMKPNRITLTVSLNACSHSGLVQEGLRYFESMTCDHGIVPSQEHYACLVDLLGRAGCFDELINQLKKMPDVQRRFKYISHESAINLIKHEKDPQRALDMFHMVSEQKGFNHNCATYATILNKLAQSKKFQAVDAVLRQMKYDTCRFHEGIFLNLMKHFSKSSLHERMLEMFYAIQPFVRQKPSLKAISTCLNILIESNQIELARNFLLHSKNSLGLIPNTCIFNILVKHHCKNGDVKSAFEVLREMRKSSVSYPNLITYSTLMDGLCASGRLKEAIDLFEEMVSEDHILPDPLTYNVLINGFCCVGKVDQAKKIMEFMKNNGCNPNIFNYSALMNGFCKEGRLQEAIEIFDEMKSFRLKVDAVGYTTLINCFCRTGRIDEATELLKEMKERGCKADIVTFNVLIGGLCRESRSEEALRMLEKLPYEGVYLNKASYRIVLNYLCHKGELEKATELLSLMLGRGFCPHYATSNELLVRLCKAGMVDDAAMALLRLADMGFKPELDSWTPLL
ncbi:PPR domain-containing protein/PPR_2 domain-containing protein/PPR_3 domain-containing protein, partial [Cephalotus follicularis]